MNFRILILAVTVLITGCVAPQKTPYNGQWSKAKNLSHAAGLADQMYDQQLPASAYNEEGKLFDYKLGNISHPAYGSASGVVGMSVMPYGPFESFYWGWTVPGISHHNEHRLFAWMPKDMAEDAASAKITMEIMLSRASLAILEEMGFQHELSQSPYQHQGISFKQWFLGQEGGHCSIQKQNCVLSLYLPEPQGIEEAPSFSFYSIASEPSWFSEASDENTYPRLVIAEGEARESVRENVFYQKLSARLPGWVYFYMAPNEVGTGENNRTVAYPYILEKGSPLLFIRPVK